MKLINRIKRQINPLRYWKKQGLKAGENCEIYPTVTIDSEPYLVEIGNNVRINSGCHLITHDGACWVVRYTKRDLSDVDLFGKITIGNNVSVGTKSLILPNIKIGDNVIIGAGSIVTHDVPSNVVVAGIPAKIIETFDEYYEKHKSQFMHTKKMNRKDKRKFIEENL